MLPIYFNSLSHLWIAYLFVFNGLLLTYGLRAVSVSYAQLTKPFEATILSGFFLSLSINSLVLLGLDFLEFDFSIAGGVLLAVSLLLACWLFSLRRSIERALTLEFCYWRAALYVVVFVMLFYNGGMIEQVTDAWWHMSLANKIGLASSFTLEQGHLNGIFARYYPPLWHGNLALANVLSGVSIDTFWNSFTAWNAAFKVMGFYLFALGLTDQKRIAMVAALLFVLLPGMGNSYLRVSAWPSHISYTAWFVCFYVSFLLSKPQSATSGLANELVSLLKTKVAYYLSLIVLGTLMLFTHQAELLWFFIAVFAYLIGRSLNRVLARSPIQEAGEGWLRLVYWLMLIGLFGASVWFAIGVMSGHKLASDYTIVLALPLLLLVILASFEILPSNAVRRVPVLIVVMCAIASLLAAIDYQHLASLFAPELALPRQGGHAMPVAATGYFGDVLALPGWHLQLRQGILWSGVVGIVVSLFLVLFRPSKSTVFLASSSWVAVMFCISPYLYQWLQDILAYHSPWRIAILIFHPLIFAVALQLCWDSLKGRSA